MLLVFCTGVDFEDGPESPIYFDIVGPSESLSYSCFESPDRVVSVICLREMAAEGLGRVVNFCQALPIAIWSCSSRESGLIKVFSSAAGFCEDASFAVKFGVGSTCSIEIVGDEGFSAELFSVICTSSASFIDSASPVALDSAGGPRSARIALTNSPCSCDARVEGLLLYPHYQFTVETRDRHLDCMTAMRKKIGCRVNTESIASKQPNHHEQEIE